MHGAIRHAVIHNLDSLTDRTNQFSRNVGVGKISAFHLFHRNFHVFDQGQVYEALGSNRHEGVAGDGEGPLVDLEYEVLGPKLGSVMVWH